MSKEGVLPDQRRGVGLSYAGGSRLDDQVTIDARQRFGQLTLVQVNADGVFRYAASPWFSQALRLLANSGVHGVAVDVWVRGRRFFFFMWPLLARLPC